MKPFFRTLNIASCFFLATATAPAEDLVTPAMTGEAPAAGKRVRQTAPEYEGTEVYHSLYLPNDWKPGANIPSSSSTPATSSPRGRAAAKSRTPT